MAEPPKVAVVSLLRRLKDSIRHAHHCRAPQAYPCTCDALTLDEQAAFMLKEFEPPRKLTPDAEVNKAVAQVMDSIATDVARLLELYEKNPSLNDRQPASMTECLPCSIDEWAIKLSGCARDWENPPEPAKEERKYTTIPVEIHGFSSKDIPVETRKANAERANRAMELMDAASRAIVQEITHLVKITGAQEFTDAFAHLNCAGMVDALIHWARKHEAAGAELHGACCNRPTSAATQKILDEQLE